MLTKHIKCPVSKIRLRLKTVETGQYFYLLMPLKMSANLLNFVGKDIKLLFTIQFMENHTIGAIDF